MHRFATDFASGGLAPHDIPARLARLGLELLGHGDTALVWGHPDEPFAVKVGRDGADGWPAWAAWCRAHLGPHVPVIHVCHINAHHGRRVGVVERLWPSSVLAGWLAGDRHLKRDPLRLASLIEAEQPRGRRHAARGGCGVPQRTLERSAVQLDGSWLG